MFCRRHHLLALVAALALAACDSVDSTAPADALPASLPVASNKVDFDPMLQRDISLLNVQEQRENERLAVRVTLENRGYEPKDFNYQFAWVREDGTVVDTPPPLWKPGFILGRERVHLTGTAPVATVVDYRLKVVSRETYRATVEDQNRR